MTSGSTRELMAMRAIAQRFGRPGTPTDQAWTETWAPCSTSSHPGNVRRGGAEQAIAPASTARPLSLEQVAQGNLTTGASRTPMAGCR